MSRDNLHITIFDIFEAAADVAWDFAPHADPHFLLQLASVTNFRLQYRP